MKILKIIKIYTQNKQFIMKRIRNLSQKAFSKKYLLCTNVCISISLSAVGDSIEQNYEIIKGELENYSSTRTKNMSCAGATVGVMCHYWYQFLDKRLIGRTFSVVTKKVILDQFICSPLVISMFFLTLGILEKSTSEEIINEIKGKAWKLYVAEWVVWPPAQVISFYWLPTKYRVLYDNIISLGYDVYTSKVIQHGKVNRCI